MAKLKVNDSEINLAASAIKCSADDFGATAPVRLYKASTGSWEYTGVCGVAVVIRNATINVVNILVVDLKTKVVALNQEVYKDFEYKVMTPYMHAFEGDDVIFGLNFAETFDATVFERTTKGLISVCNANIPAPSKPITTGSPKTVVSKPSQPTKTAQSTSTSQAQGGGIGSKFKGLFGIGAKKEAPRERPKISGAKNFKHVAHLGFNSKDGFGNIPPEWRSIFEKAGVTEEELKDAKTAKFILKTIASAGGPPPPPPQKESSQAVSSVSTGAPPPPGPPPPLMPTTKKAPPPPPSSKPGPDVSAPQESSSSGTGEGRGDMLAQIQQGNFKLKKVTAEDIPEVAQMSEQEQNTLASKIQLAMQARRQAVVDDDEDDDDEDWEI